MFRYLFTKSPRELSMGMLLDPVGDGSFRRAAEADNWKGLVAAVLGDPAYETDAPPDRLVKRLHLAHNAQLLVGLEHDGKLQVADRDAPATLNVSSDETLIRGLDRNGVVSLEPALKETGR